MIRHANTQRMGPARCGQVVHLARGPSDWNTFHFARPGRQSRHMSRLETVKLTSADGFEFIISREAACVSNTIKSMLDSQGGSPGCARSER